MPPTPDSAKTSTTTGGAPSCGPTSMGEGIPPAMALPGEERLNHVGADLAGYDFSGCDLRGVDFTGAHLSDAQFVGADLTGAILDNVHAESANFSQADLTGASLCRAGLSEATFTEAKLEDVTATDAFLEGACFMGASITGASLVGAHLGGTGWSEANLSGADLRRTDLTKADLSAVNVSGACFDDADLSLARLSRVAGFRRASWLGVDAAATDSRGACFVHDFIQDQNFLAEYRSQGLAYEWTYRIWWLTSDCGRSVVRWSMCSFGLAAMFAIAYTQVGIDYGDYSTPLSPLYFSVVTLTTLGFGDALPATMAAQMVVMGEVIIGYVMLGGLLSLISNKLSRRAS